MKMSITRRLLLLGSSALALVAGLPRLSSAQGTRARVTFVLVSDIYLMSDQPAPGFAAGLPYASVSAIVPSIPPSLPSA